MNKNDKNELSVLESDFHNKVSDLMLNSQQNYKMMSRVDGTTLAQTVKKELEIDMKALNISANEMIAENEEASDEEIAIKLLKEFSKDNTNRLLKKISTEMIKEEWWKK
ncbi:hypothetical protein [Exiguobacterium mexicanum]|uniref:hypothetical protein n=1 Tax=Exiguobacterium mexicanum TaxID=340146 RepID=UPI00110D27DE|nr:hypothetical protein [Exiguobacterium mexicanum]